MKSLQREEMQNKDIRSKLMQEIFTGIKVGLLPKFSNNEVKLSTHLAHNEDLCVLNTLQVLKMYAWELSFQKVAQHLRDQEFRTLAKIANANVVFQSIFQNSPFLV